MRILIAEDDPKLLKSLLKIFEMHNFSADGVLNGTDAYDYAKTGEYDGLVLDIMMPGQDGITLLKRLRAEGVSTPALFLSARGEVYQRIEGLEAGADDYLAKPFSTGELIARVRAMLRRKDTYTPDIVTLGSLSLNRSTYEISSGGRSAALSGKEFRLFEMLIERHGSLVSTEQIIVNIWGWDASVDSSVVWVHVSNIRKKLESVGADVRVRFVRGAGYILEECDAK